MKQNSVLLHIAKTEQGKALLKELESLRDNEMVLFTDGTAPDSALRYMSGRISILNKLITQLQDK